MAKMTIKGMDDYARKLSQLGQASVAISRKAVYAGASVVADEVKKRLENNIKDTTYVGKKPGGGVKSDKSTGDLVESLGVAPIGVDGRGNTNTKIGFDGYDSNGVPNALKARAMESGTSTLRKRPFVRPAVNAVKGKAQEKMGAVVDEEIAKIYAL